MFFIILPFPMVFCIIRVFAYASSIPHIIFPISFVSGIISIYHNAYISLKDYLFPIVYFLSNLRYTLIHQGKYKFLLNKTRTTFTIYHITYPIPFILRFIHIYHFSYILTMDTFTTSCII